MPKYIIHQQQTTYSWYWECKHNPSINGICNSKREAREKCRNGEASITPPSVWIKDGILIEFSHKNLLGESQTFSSEEKSWDTIELEIDADHIYHWLFK